MNNPFQEQLLKAGLVTKQQVHKAKKDKHKKNKQNRSSKNSYSVGETALKAQQTTNEKAERDRELNRDRHEQAQKKAISAEISQLITNNSIDRTDDCDIAYNFQHNGKVKRIYINNNLKHQLILGKCGIARIDGRYELVPKSIAEKIQKRNGNRVILFDDKEHKIDENDSYAGYQIPDDLTW
ncbi:MAG TPA: DUF2058 domain-containing protein [Gammaproteobacteria bacterium]|nr:DUF2058 domain-containing protein [Gammaproteobacteria bacterium]